MTVPRVVCLGEALVDLIAADPDGRTWRAVPGGAPYNAAIATARLGAPTTFLGVLSSDRFGDVLRRHLRAAGVEHEHCPTTSEPTTLAVFDGDDDFSFHVNGTSSVSARVNDIHLPPDAGVVHVSGSVALVVEPAASRLDALLVAAHHRAIVHVDANPRRRLIDRDRYLRRFGHWLGIADIVQISTDDAEWLSPGADAVASARRWVSVHERGEHAPAVVVVTRGRLGATVVCADATVDVPAPSVQVVDTVGAGDTFSGAMLAALAAHEVSSREELEELDSGWWRTAATYACEAASLTCTRAGADPPRRGEL